MKNNNTFVNVKTMLFWAVAGIVLLPLQIFVFLMSFSVWRLPYLVLHELFGFDWSTGGSSLIDVRRFFEFWVTGFGIYILYMLVNIAVVARRYKNESVICNKPRFCIVGILLTAAISSAFVGDIRRPATSGWFPCLGYHTANAFLFALVMFSTFVFVSFLLDKYTKKREILKVTLAFVISMVLGFLLSGVVWLILFNIFN